VFTAFELTALKNLKVVILGQDPYHGPNQAHWLSFSVECEKLPPSLKNIYKELHSDLGITPSKSGNLSPWASQWVFLLNAFLTVQAWNPASHAKIGWEKFSDIVISEISQNTSGIIFVLWGNFAQNKKHLIDTSKHFVLESSHPSPLWAYKWFLWSKVFSNINEILTQQKKSPINWEL
jgi:uracil-DNA glycosylase